MLRSTLTCLCLFAATLAQAQPPAAAKATIVVKVPADAVVTVADQKMTQTGPVRSFQSPPLEPGVYSYTVVAKWKENGVEVVRQYDVPLRPGTTSVLEFSLAADPKAAAAPTETPKESSKETPKLADAKSRHFQFTYAGKVTDLKPGQEAKVWLPVPQTTPEQTVTLDYAKIPAKFEEHHDPLYRNKILSFTAQADDKGEIPFAFTVNATRKEVRTDVHSKLVVPAKEEPSLVERFLQADAKVPVGGKPMELLKDKKLPSDSFDAAKVLYDVVNGHMKYSKVGEGWGRGDAVWACDSKFGNCTDFHSLFISMARGAKIPSKFEMGFPLPEKRGEGELKGYHCWAYFLPKNLGWVPVDISEANQHPDQENYYFGNLTENRIQFTTGRDIDLVPRQSGPPLNFFVYPYVEVNGQTYPAEKVQRSFSFKDL